MRSYFQKVSCCLHHSMKLKRCLINWAMVIEKLKENTKGIKMKPPSRYHITEDMWREAIKTWTSSTFRKRSEINTKNKNVHTMFHCAGTRSFADIRKAEKEKTGTDPDRADVFILSHTRKDGAPVNEDCAIAIEKLKALKQSQLSTNSSHPVVARDDSFAMVFGEEKSGRVRGVGTGPTPVSLWGKKNEILRSENNTLHDRIKVLEEKFAKLEKKDVDENESQVRKESQVFASSMASKECTSGIESMTGKKVKLLDLENEQVGEGIIMSMDPNKIVMGRPIGYVYCEVSVIYANIPNAPLFVKDDQRCRMKDAIGSHILWIRDYVLLDEPKRQLFSG